MVVPVVERGNREPDTIVALAATAAAILPRMLAPATTPPSRASSVLAAWAGVLAGVAAAWQVHAPAWQVGRRPCAERSTAAATTLMAPPDPPAGLASGGVLPELRGFQLAPWRATDGDRPAPDGAPVRWTTLSGPAGARITLAIALQPAVEAILLSSTGEALAAGGGVGGAHLDRRRLLADFDLGQPGALIVAAGDQTLRELDPAAPTLVLVGGRVAVLPGAAVVGRVDAAVQWPAPASGAPFAAVAVLPGELLAIAHVLGVTPETTRALFAHLTPHLAVLVNGVAGGDPGHLYFPSDTDEDASPPRRRSLAPGSTVADAASLRLDRPRLVLQQRPATEGLSDTGHGRRPAPRDP